MIMILINENTDARHIFMDKEFFMEEGFLFLLGRSTPSPCRRSSLFLHATSRLFPITFLCIIFDCFPIISFFFLPIPSTSYLRRVFILFMWVHLCLVIATTHLADE